VPFGCKNGSSGYAQAILYTLETTYGVNNNVSEFRIVYGPGGCAQAMLYTLATTRVLSEFRIVYGPGGCAQAMLQHLGQQRRRLNLIYKTKDKGRIIQATGQFVPFGCKNCKNGSSGYAQAILYTLDQPWVY
jgi:shikimate 5-dehydrogenase